MSTPPSAQAQAGAPAPARRGMSGTAKNMVISMIVLVAGCLVLIALVPRVGSVQQPVANVAAIAREVGDEQKWDVAVADGLPTGWTATNVTLMTDNPPDTWQAGYTTPGTHYAAVVQTSAGDAAWVTRQTGAAKRVGTISLGGATWIRYERNDGEQQALVRTVPLGGLTTAVIGTAPWSQLNQFAAALRPLSHSTLHPTS
ncbi:DUF4245 domain-containing protein [Allobranchiibius sp. CTAmp26]|uniref:DUF4245 domain-containing protein n=1 Tax=Allobranchiibius sp. CTAmp26 TaxID=2815214 RepID=UPI001AA15CB0|nr:DUF4245 domain-containing protein [Allobranchiibius sp. CTAmp26]MBO1756369.1 DUF4245 domain-containing protein [Allobranchiibius sp. CTAmp26]